MKINCAHDQLVEIHKLIPNPKNPNKHPDDQIERLAKIIDYQGQRSPIVVSKQTGFIVVGHGRMMAMKKLGWEKVAVNYQDFENKAQEYAHLTADNAIAEWAALDLAEINKDFLEHGPDLDIELLGLKDFVVEPIEKLDPLTDEDSVPEVKDPITKRGDVWILGNHRVMCGDSTMIDDVEKLMNGEKADMVFTDPPYNIDFKPPRGTHEKIKNDNMSNDDFRQFLHDVFGLCKLFMHPDTYLISFMGWSTIPDFKHAISDHFQIKSMPIWKKNNFGIGYYTRPQYEPFYLCLNGDPIKPARAPSDVFEFNKVSKTVHSCEKPVDMIVGICDNFNKNGLFYEPFSGSGSTLIACEKTNRKCFGMELDEHYCDVIINRWQEYTGKKAVLESNGKTYDELKEANAAT